MNLTAEERAEISRANGRKGGVATEAGKKRSHMNACKHYMTATVVPMPGEDPAILAERRAHWLERYEPESPAAYYYLNMCISAEVLADRCEAAGGAALVRNADMV